MTMSKKVTIMPLKQKVLLKFCLYISGKTHSLGCSKKKLCPNVRKKHEYYSVFKEQNEDLYLYRYTKIVYE